jgi:two-component system OmpR family response regulator
MIQALMVEDDVEIAELLSQFLSQNEIEVKHVIRPSEAMAVLHDKKFDIVILDLSLPEMDGLELCRKIRKITDVSVIISSARTDIGDKLQALDDGADDYLPKPYDPRELLARIKAIVKRAQPEKVEEEPTLFRIDEDARLIYFKNEVLQLTSAEYDILTLFLGRINHTISRIDIANSIDSHRFESGVESINVLIGRLRKKIESKPQEFIQTVRGIGYRFVTV